jgi:hypothetical protein
MGRPPRGKGIQTMECGCRLMLVVCLTALVCGWLFVLLSSLAPVPELQAT